MVWIEKGEPGPRLQVNQKEPMALKRIIFKGQIPSDEEIKKRRSGVNKNLK
jgi:hypothetical protein